MTELRISPASVVGTAGEIQAAVDRLGPGGGTVVLVGGSWHLAETVRLTDDVRLIGREARLVRFAQPGVEIADAARVAVEGLRCELLSEKNFRQMIRVTDCAEVTISGVSCVDSGARDVEWTPMAVAAAGCHGLTVQDSDFQGCQVKLAGVGSSARVTARRLTFHRPLQYAISAVTRGAGGTLQTVTLEDVEVVDPLGGGALYVGCDDAEAAPGSSCDDVIVRRVTIRGRWGSPWRGINIRHCERGGRYLVEDVEIDGDSRGNNTTGILVAPRSGGRVRDVWIRRVQVHSVDHEGIRVEAADGVRLEDCELRDSRGITVPSDAVVTRAFSR